jgi:mersacidin/lichenicidin family type 2 lantibiotic
MSHVNIVRAWKDEEYRRSLPEADRAHLPENPAGLIELPERDLSAVVGGDGWLTTGNAYLTIGQCSTLIPWCHRQPVLQ